MSEQERHPPTTAADEEADESKLTPARPSEPVDEDEAFSFSTSDLSVLDIRMRSLRENSTQRRLAVGIAVMVGLIATVWHWSGLVLGGALVGVTRKSLPRALVSGFAFGLLVLIVFVAALELTADVSPGAFGVLSPLSALTIGLTLLGPTWGALLRGAI